jgi:hypothetical protein
MVALKEGRRKKEEGRRKKEEARGTKEEGRRKREEFCFFLFPFEWGRVFRNRVSVEPSGLNPVFLTRNPVS